jgi:sterol desaturase/sphingolipid hydroxylase (fatty acid hydroxylase superfamily)
MLNLTPQFFCKTYTDLAKTPWVGYAPLDSALVLYSVFLTSFIAFNVPYAIFALGGFFEQYRIEKHTLKTRKELINSMLHTLAMVTGIVFPMLTASTVVMPSVYDVDRPCFTEWSTLFAFIAFCQIVEDIVFYSLHWVLHRPALYARIHKKHHQFQHPYSWTSVHTHPIELIVGNFLPVMVGPMIWPAHSFALACWVSVRIWITTEVHSGMNLPWNLERWIGKLYAGPIHHDAHHSRFVGNYSSTFTWLDLLFGTYVEPHKKGEVIKEEDVYKVRKD